MPQNVLEHEIAHGKKISHNAEEIWGWESKAGRRRAERRANYFINLGSIKQPDKVLEIGCGTGIFTQKVYLTTKANITAIDISEELLKQASAKIPEVNFKIDDAMNLSFPDNNFDIVFGSSILHHLDYQKSSEEIFRVLKPGGRLVFAEPNMLNPQIFIQKNVPFIKRWLGDSPDETAVVRWKMKKLLKQTGFKDVEIFPYDFLHPAVPGFCISLASTIGKVIEKIPLLKEVAGSVIIYAKK
jgi:ubiquinone/menaquinone biosynthesis C-methylase UbiE